MSVLSWTHREPQANSLIGFNFSCDQAEYLLLEDRSRGQDGYLSDDRPGRAEWCAATLDVLLRETGARTVRLSLYWDEVESRRAVFDFQVPDALVAVAARNGATVMLSVGMKAQRHPEYYIPDWASEGLSLPDRSVVSDDPVLRSRALAFVAEAVRHYANEPAIDSWGAENEARIASHRSDHYSLSREYAALVVETIRSNDPRGRPVSINHAQHFVMDQRWREALADSDVLGQSMYPARNVNAFGVPLVVNIMEIGPLMPNYAFQARTARDSGKQFWVTELQAEPWTDADSRLITPANPSANLDPSGVRQNIQYARKSGAERIYLWGAEFWVYQASLGDQSWMREVSTAVADRYPE